MKRKAMMIISATRQRPRKRSSRAVISLRLGARSGIGYLPLGTDGNVHAPCPHAHAAVSPGATRDPSRAISGNARVAPSSDSELLRLTKMDTKVVHGLLGPTITSTGQPLARAVSMARVGESVRTTQSAAGPS
jgi:hypothetical protein